MPLLGGAKASGSGGGQEGGGEAMQPPPAGGRTDLLLRFFDSQFFDEWIALTYLYKSTSPGVQDYLCNRLYALPERGLERYLSQLCQLIISRPGCSLERVVVDLCAKSLRIAVKVYWLLLAISQDQPRNSHVAELRDRCERAALEGYWEPPFRDPKLLPMSPPRARWLVGSPTSPASRPSSFKLRLGSPEAFVSPPRTRPGEQPERPTSPDGLGGGIYSSYSMGAGLEGLICASPSAVRAAIREGKAAPGSDAKDRPGAERLRRLRVETGAAEPPAAPSDAARRPLDAANGEAAPLSPPQPSGAELAAFAEQLSPPSSPRLRQTTFGATLDFIEALCDASSGLTAFAPEDRQWALRKGLEEINKEIELASRMGVACWFPMGGRNERIVRLAGREAVLLNSREKAPFMLIVEVLSEEEAAAAESSAESAPAESSGDGGAVQQQRAGSHAGAGPGPGSAQAAALNGRHSPEQRRPRHAVSSQPQPVLTHPQPLSQQQQQQQQQRGASGSPTAAAAAASGSSAWRLSSSFRGREAGEGRARAKPYGAGDESFSRGLKTAMEGLQGSGPLVTLTLEVLNGEADYTPTLSEPSSSSSVSTFSWGSPDLSGPGGVRGWDPRGHPKPSRVGVIHEDDDVAFGGPSKGIGGLLCTWAACRAKEPEGRGAHGLEPYVRVTLTVNGGVDLRLNNKPLPSHRRVPSDEAILRMAAQQRVRLPDPREPFAGCGPLPEAGPALAPEAAPPPAERPANAEGGSCAEAGGSCGEAGGSRGETAAEERRAAEAAAVFGERFAQKRARVQAASPYGRKPGWAARPVIVKSGDDCRQELLAAQLIDAFADIFREAQLPLYLRPYEVLCTSSRTALIECVPDTLSLHQLKARVAPAGGSLADWFAARFGKGTPACEAAQRNFAESMAAYSLVCYLLQIKDRHNGNILLDAAGRLIHIDFGFMLSNSPGGVNFEAAPFKLTRELLEVLDSGADGAASEMFDYFKVLCIQGFLACRKHADRIILLVEMMQGSGCPCFKAGPRAVAALRKRFHLALPESQCVEVVLGLISDSVDAWRTRQYDQYQRVMNGIL